MPSFPGQFPTTRLRRLRQHPVLREMLQMASITVNDLICPIFVTHGQNSKQPIESMPGQYRWSIDLLPQLLEELVALDIRSIMLFGLPQNKDPLGEDSYSDNGIMQQAIRVVKQQAPSLYVTTDICFCEYTDHGHCGALTDEIGRVDVHNDTTLELLQKQALSHAQAGADMLVPSGMMDGVVQALRHTLDNHGFSHIPIMSHSIKYASVLYSAFREAVDCSLSKGGDRKSYQADHLHDAAQALREVALDLQEGTDMVVVKPIMHYLDIVQQIKQQFPGVPIVGYHVSTEYMMYKLTAKAGLVDEQRLVFELLNSIKRAGCDLIVTYYAQEVAKWLKNK